jgi:hypothetical protein
LDSDQLSFWLGNGANCDISAFKFLNVFMLIKSCTNNF